MKGLSKDGLRAKIANNILQLTEAEAVDMFFFFPTLTELEWKKGNAVSAKVNGLNLEFSIKN